MTPPIFDNQSTCPKSMHVLYVASRYDMAAFEDRTLSIDTGAISPYKLISESRTRRLVQSHLKSGHIFFPIGARSAFYVKWRGDEG